MTTEKAPAARSKKPKRYFIVNPAGAVHEVTQKIAAERLRLAGWRTATKAEATKYTKQKIQRAGAGFGTIYNPEPEPVDLE